jgi:hypothetical protein
VRLAASRAQAHNFRVRLGSAYSIEDLPQKLQTVVGYLVARLFHASPDASQARIPGLIQRDGFAGDEIRGTLLRFARGSLISRFGLSVDKPAILTTDNLHCCHDRFHNIVGFIPLLVARGVASLGSVTRKI